MNIKSVGIYRRSIVLEAVNDDFDGLPVCRCLALEQPHVYVHLKPHIWNFFNVGSWCDPTSKHPIVTTLEASETLIINAC
jgi:hypothetical protein